MTLAGRSPPDYKRCVYAPWAWTPDKWIGLPVEAVAALVAKELAQLREQFRTPPPGVRL